LENAPAGKLTRETSTMRYGWVYIYTSLVKAESITRYAYLPEGEGLLSQINYGDKTTETYIYALNGNIKTYTDRSALWGHTTAPME